MKKIITVLILLFWGIHSLIGRDIICEVSSQFTYAQISGNKYRFNDIKSAFDFVSEYNVGNRIRIVLCDEQTYINSPLALQNNKCEIIVKPKHKKAEIINGVKVNRFEQKGDTLLFPVGRTISKIYVNGNYVPITTTFSTASEMRQYKNFKSVGNGMYSATFPKEELNTIEVGCDVFVYCRWLCHMLRVEDVNKKTGVVTLSCSFNPTYASDATAYYSVYNSRKLLKSNSFCYYEGKVYYLMNNGQNVKKLETRVPVASAILSIDGCNNISFENITFKGAEVSEWYVEGVQGARNLIKAVTVRNSTNVKFTNCDFSNNDGYSLGIDNSCHCYVSKCAFVNLGGGGIALGFGEKDETHNITIDNNLFKGIGRIHPGAEAIISYKAHDISITNNTICDVYYSGIGLGFTWGGGNLYSYNNYVANNHIHHVMRGVLSDGGGIYTLGNQRGTVIEKNYIHDVISRVCSEAGSSLIYFDEGSSDIIARNNVLLGAHTGFHENYGRNNVLEDNIIGYTNLVAFRLSNAKLDSMLVAKNNYVVIDKGTAYNGLFAKFALCEGNKTLEGIELDEDKGTKPEYYHKLTDNNSLSNIKKLYKSGYIKEKFSYGVKSRRLKNMESLSEDQILTDRVFVVNTFNQVSEYFNR